VGDDGEVEMAQVSGIIYARFQAPDLDRMERFLIDFGLTRAARTSSALYMRGTGEHHHIHITELGEKACGLGIGLRVDSYDDLRELAETSGGTITDCSEPGGGQVVTLRDPNGFRVDLIYGQERVDPLPVREPLILNDARVVRREGVLQRPQRGASHVDRMEHAVLGGPNFDEALSFYQNLLGMKISDRMYDQHESNVAAVFMRFGLGGTYTDHHSVAVAKAPEAGFDHTAYIVLDWDDLMLGHHHLKAAGHQHDWGVGRHKLGSEVFDYWRDPFGNKMEHTSDCDRINDDHVPSNLPFEEEHFAVWGPQLSAAHG